ncbi:MAG: hypothetical protein ACRDPY_27775 [Streptosporangiaceae bacterium]
MEFVAAGIHQLTRSVATGRHYGRDPVFLVIPGLNAVVRAADGALVFTSSGPPPFGTFGGGAGSVPAAAIQAQIPVYIGLIADGSVRVPFRTFPLSDVGAAWAASAESGPRVVLVRD